MSGDDEAEDVENQYLHALTDILPRIREHAGTCATAFDKVTRAMDNGAWSSTTADAFDEELRDLAGAAEDAGHECREAFETREANEEEMVPEEDWRARFTPYPPDQGYY